MIRPLATTLAGLIALSPAAAQAQGVNPFLSIFTFPMAQAERAEPPARRRAAPAAKPAAKPKAARTAARRPERKPANPRVAAERNGYKLVSSLVNFPRFFPGIGILYVKPETLPHGPFLAFDRKDTLVSTIYMVPMSEFQEHRRLGFDRMRQRGDHVELYYNPGHAGVDMPHYHVVVWHVPKAEERRVAR